MGDRPCRSLQHRRIVALGMAWRAPSTERHVSAALCVACPGVRAVSCSAAVLDIRAALCRVARVSLARNRSADQWIGRLHVWPSAHVDAMGDRLLQPSIREFPGRLGSWRLYDIQGNYDLIWWICVGLGVFAALIHWFIREQPVERLTLVAVRS